MGSSHDSRAVVSVTMFFHHMQFHQVGFVKGATTVDAPVSGGTPAAEQVGVGEPRSTRSGVVYV